jgi:hypothetical protein
VGFRITTKKGAVIAETPNQTNQRREEKAGKKSVRFKNIRSLSQDKQREINGMLIRGDTAVDVVKIIQEKWGDLTHVSANTLASQLRKYLNEELMTASKVSDIPDHDTREAVVLAFNERVDVMAEMSNVIGIQRQRIMQMTAREGTAGLPFSWVRNDIETFASLCRQFMDMEFETGSRVKVPEEHTAHLIGHNGPAEYQNYIQDRSNDKVYGGVLTEILGVIDGDSERVT